MTRLVSGVPVCGGDGRVESQGLQWPFRLWLGHPGTCQECFTGPSVSWSEVGIVLVQGGLSQM